MCDHYLGRVKLWEKLIAIGVMELKGIYTPPVTWIISIYRLISELLTGLTSLRSLKKIGIINVKEEYTLRRTRRVPPMAATILTCTYLLPEISAGPQRNPTVKHHAEKCEQYWWRNFMSIHNYFGFDEMVTK